MDRLEKALEKVRQQRNVGNETTVAEAPPPPPAQVAPQPQAPAQPPRPATKPLSLDEGDMERHRIVARQKRDANADVFRMLRTKVLQAMARSNMKTIAVTSPNYGEGKTTVAMNLAMSLALDVNQTVLLVDLDLRDPTIHKYLGIPNTVGLSDYILHDTPVPQCLVRTDFERLALLPSGKPLEGSSELLGTPKMVELARQLKSRYPDRIVIYDMPPLLTQDDTMVFLPNVDGVLLVLRDGKTIADDVEKCMYALENSNLIGTVLNDSTEESFNKT